jgi:hypothetical protein
MVTKGYRKGVYERVTKGIRDEYRRGCGRSDVEISLKFLVQRRYWAAAGGGVSCRSENFRVTLDEGRLHL